MALFKKPWNLTDGFLFGGILVLMGFILQIASGPVDWELINSPVNLVLLLLCVAIVIIAFLLRKRSGFFAWLGSSEAAVPSIAWAFILTIVMGLTAQIPERGWLGSMTTFWPFLLCYVWLTVVVGLVALDRLAGLGKNWRGIASALLHLGFFVTLVFASLGSVDKKDLEMTLHEGETVSMASDETGKTYDTGLSVRLDDFTMEVYPSEMPKRFASDVVVTGKSGKDMTAVIEVNKPIEVDGWKMYQYGYDEEAGVESTVSVLELVKNPWLPLVYAGIFMMLAGAFLMLFTGFKREESR